MSLYIVTLTVNGMRDYNKRNAIFQWCKKQKIDIVCLQETHCSNDVIDLWSKEWGSKCIWNNGTSSSRGVAMLFSKNFNLKYEEVYKDVNGRILICSVTFSESYKFSLANVYLPNSGVERKEFLLNFTHMKPENKNCLVGDFNCILSKTLDRRPEPLREDAGTCELKSFLEKNDLIDIWRMRNPSKNAILLNEEIRNLELTIFLSVVNLTRTHKRSKLYISHSVTTTV